MPQDGNENWDDGFEIPNNNYIQQKVRQTKKNVQTVFDEYKALLADQTHPDNQTKGYKNNIQSTINRLLSLAKEMDEVDPGQGVFGLDILSLLSILKVKNETVRLKVEIRDLKRELKKMQKQLNSRR